MKLAHRGEYPEHWPLLSEWVKRAVGHACIRCGHPSGDRRTTHDEYFAGEGDDNHRKLVACTERCTHPKDGKLRALTVHHMDGDKGNDHWWNLLALCQVCHLQIQAKLVPERPYMWEHREWFKPYVAGFYAAQSGLFFARFQIEAKLDFYLAMGQPHLAEPM